MEMSEVNEVTSSKSSQYHLTECDDEQPRATVLYTALWVIQASASNTRDNHRSSFISGVKRNIATVLSN